MTPNYLSAIWKKSLVDYKNINMDINLILLIKQAMEDYTTVLIFSNGISRYILSDNPVIFNFSKKADKNIPGGIFFPISPDILVAYVKYEKDDLYRKNLLMLIGTEGFIKYINAVLLNQSFNEVGYCNDDILSLFDETWNENYWENMFTPPTR